MRQRCRLEPGRTAGELESPVRSVVLAGPDALIVTETTTVSVEAEATHISEALEVSIEGAQVGDQILAKDLVVPSGVTVLLDEDTMIVNVTHAPTAEEVDSELAEAEAEVGIERDESEEEAAEATEGSTEGESSDEEKPEGE